MFTGIIEAVGTVSSRTASAITVTLPLTGIAIGDSIAVNGVCLTAAWMILRRTDSTVRFDASPETLRTTTLGRLRGGEPVNIERALPLDGRVGGHFVTGHIEGIGKLVRSVPSADSWRMTFQAPAGMMAAILPRGSIAVDGVSLTVASVNGRRFTTAVIPHTRTHTILVSRRPGMAVNLETDLLARHAAAQGPNSSVRRLTPALLRDNGF